MSEIRVTDRMIKAGGAVSWAFTRVPHNILAETYRAMRQAEMDEEAEARAGRMKAREGA